MTPPRTPNRQGKAAQKPVSTKKKARAGGAARALSKANTSAKSTVASSKVEVQERRIIKALRRRPYTTDDFRRLGIFQISARIHALRRKGWPIRTERVTVVDRDGFTHPRAGLYSLDDSATPRRAQ